MSDETERFIANGGHYERLPVGAMAETGWKSADYSPNSKAMRDRSFEQMRQAKEVRGKVEAAEREARKAAKVVEPLRVKAPQKPKAAKPSRAVVKVRKPKPVKPAKVPKPKAAKVPKVRKPAPFARDGSDKARILELMGPQWVMVAALSEQTGITHEHVRESLRLLKGRGLVESTGGVFYRHWRKVGGEAANLPPPPRRPPSGLTARVLEAVRDGHARASEIAAATRASTKDVSVRLWHLKRYGLVELTGKAHSARWNSTHAADR